MTDRTDLPTPDAPADGAITPGAVRTMTLGDVEIIRVLEHETPTRAPTAMLPDLPEERWWAERAWLEPDFWDASGSGLLMTCTQTWVLRVEDRTILVDTGAGNDKPRPGMPAFDRLRTGFLARLRAAGVEPEDVDMVVNTHLHADHVGWNTRPLDREWVPTFPRAEYLIPRADHWFWGPDNPVPPRLADANANVLADSVDPVVRAGRAVLWDESLVLGRGLRLDAAPGHTPGSSVLTVESRGERAVFVGDLLHTPLQVLHPDASSCLCEDPAEAAASRRRVLGWAADHGALVFPAHLRGGLAMEVERAGSAFAIRRWAPLTTDPEVQT